MRFPQLKTLLTVSGIFVLVTTIAVYAIFRSYGPGSPVNPVLAGDTAEVALMDFVAPPSLNPVTQGWFHIKFLTKPAMQISFVKKDNHDTLRCETNGGGSIFGRFTDIDLGIMPILKWQWMVEKPVVAEAAEDTVAGDDHPARFLVQFADAEAREHSIEIIWSNGKYKEGEWKIIGDFHHYVVNGGDARSGENTNIWFGETVNLLQLYQTATKRSDTPRLKYISIFCDTDDTKTSSVAYFSDVKLAKAQ